ncbi:sulfite exporter TauE/SafE family protein [Empedobacter brevis]|uniref:sulfite exporter TauE/SafE family protein n=1 Tax=Empedobacter brevis TaxID=247 RepID=UPI0023F380C0|nr:sulfite exporter TauE/SafE family protein [Empedobacter brevis]
MSQYIGYVMTILVGVTLGLMGSGGSILTVPNLVYLFGLNPIQATSYSLFIIGISSIIGSYPKVKNKLVNYRVAIIFGIPSMLVMFATRRLFMPQLPSTLQLPFVGEVEKNFILMITFAIVMLLAAYSMITNKQKDCIDCGKKMEKNTVLLVIQGVIIGFISGIFGAGGGFLIIPGLVVFAKVPMKNAVATSLFLVAINSLVGFGSDYQQFSSLNWVLLTILTLLSVVGIMIGNSISKFISSTKLKPLFGYFILVIAVLILGQELLF